MGTPTVSYRETVERKQKFDYLHKKQTGGAGQYARVIGYIEPLKSDDPDDYGNLFENKVVGATISNEFIGACEKGFYEGCEKGPITQVYPIVNVKMVLEDGAVHSVDSSSQAFMTAIKMALNQAFQNGGPVLMEPIMSVECTVPNSDFQKVMAAISKRKGLVTNTEGRSDIFILQADVPLSQMFGFATEMRGMTSGIGEFSMEYKTHAPVSPNEMEEISEMFKKRRQQEK